MAYSQRTSVNRITGETEVLKKASQKLNRKSGELVAGVYVTYLETAGGLIKVEISPCNKEGKTGGDAVWVKFTKKKKQAPQAAARF